MEQMAAAISKELTLRHHELKSRALRSVYFGGGTPSVLPPGEIQRILDDISHYFNFSEDIEITLEGNPDDLTPSFLKELSLTAVNRLSIGTQSFHEADLQLMNRAHTATEAEDAIKRAQDIGFENLSIDLIYGSPVSGFTEWQENVMTTVDLQVPHISSYALTVEPKTAMAAWQKQGKMPKPDENLQHDEFVYLSDTLMNFGFDHYEISNFGKPGYHSRHNTAYWDSSEYLGLGPSGHSYDGARRRSWNVANNARYLKNILENNLPLDTEELTDKESLNETMMIGLRTQNGVGLAKIEKEYPEALLLQLKSGIHKKIAEGHLEIRNNRLLIPRKHWFQADGIASDLFLL